MITTRTRLLSGIFLVALGSSIANQSKAAPPAVPLQPPADLASYVSIVSTTTDECGTDAFQCWRLSVSCPNLDTKEGVVKFNRANGQVKGMAMLIGGGASTAFWEGGSAAAIDAIAQINDAGFNTAQLKWDSSWTRATDGEAQGHANLACRAAAVASFVHEQFLSQASNRAFCVTGNSAGGSQVSYMLSHYNGLNGELDITGKIDLAVLTSGPPMGRIDYGCTADSLDEYAYEDPQQADSAFGSKDACTLASQGDAVSRELVRDSSIAYGGNYNYPNTDVAFIYGTGDLTNSVAQGMAYVSTLIQSGQEKITVEVLPGVAHALHHTSEGANAILNTFINRCVVN